MARENTEIRLNFLAFLQMLARRKRFLIVHSALWVMAAVAAALLLPKKYTSQVVLMPPKSSSSGISKLAKSLPMAKLAGGMGSLPLMGSGENMESIYLAILSSRTLQLEVIRKFDLVTVYKFAKRKKYFIEDVFRELAKHVSVQVTDEGTFVIRVTDRSPERAAGMANFMAQRLDEIHKRLTVETERNQRIFLEERLRLVKAELDSSETRLVEFQKDNRMLNIEEQAKATIDAGTEIEARYLAAELKLEISKKVFSAGNPKVREQEMELAQLRKQRDAMLKDRKSDLLIPYAKAPDLVLQYVRLKRDLKIQEALFEVILTQYETAKFEESKNTPTVQVLDEAVPPEKRTSPKRARIVLACLAFSLMLGVGIASLQEYLRRFARERPEDYAMLKDVGRNLWFKKSPVP
jgi:uncharacterized protein involved in exopolysaccharide biosynthesis